MRLTGHKFHAQPTEVYGYRFASKAEAWRYLDLLLLGQAGEIRNLELQPRFPLHVCGIEVSTYVADFRYEERGPREGLARGLAPWRDIIEDVKGVRTPVYRLKRRMVEAEYGFILRETGRTRARGR